MTAPIVVTCGDPSGIGLEIAIKAYRSKSLDDPFFLIYDLGHARALAEEMGVELVPITDAKDAIAAFAKGLPVLHIAFDQNPKLGVAQPANAPATITAIDMAVSMCVSGSASAMCTLPITKKVLTDAGDFPYPGHTEYLAHLGGVDQSFMMLLAPELRVVPVTIHIALDQVKTRLTRDLLTDTIMATHSALKRDFGISAPRLTISGLNPHAGEGGAMGQEELDMIIPCLENLRTQGFDINGPLPADTMFHPKARESYDVAICMYHDQALIPLKTLNFSEGVNTTLGLPFIRTSPDHGTAYDIAGKGIADPTSLIEALKCAQTMARNRAAYDAI